MNLQKSKEPQRQECEQPITIGPCYGLMHSLVEKIDSRKTVIILALWMISLCVSASQIQLAWDASDTPNVTYKLYRWYGTNTTSWATTNRLITVPLMTGTNYFAAVAVSTNGLESDPSNTILYVESGKPGAPLNLRIITVIQAGTNSWTNTWTNP